jgi:hypothetical protein
MIRHRSKHPVLYLLLCCIIVLSACRSGTRRNDHQPTPSPISTATHISTATLIPTATYTPAPSPTPLPQLQLEEAFGLGIYDQPCLEGAYGIRFPCERLASTDNGDVLSVIGQINDCEWLSVTTASESGWIPFLGKSVSFSEPGSRIGSEPPFEITTFFYNERGSPLFGANFEECLFPEIPIPDVLTSLYTMVIFGDDVTEQPRTWGYKLIIENETDKDAFVVLASGLTREIVQPRPFEPPVYEQPIVGIYVKSGDAFETGLDIGFYTLYLSLGEDWSIATGRFTRNTSYSRTTERFEAYCPLATCSYKTDTLTIKGDYAGEGLIPISASEFPIWEP